MRKAAVYISFGGCPPISMTNFRRASAKRFVDILALVQIVKAS